MKLPVRAGVKSLVQCDILNPLNSQRILDWNLLRTCATNPLRFMRWLSMRVWMLSHRVLRLSVWFLEGTEKPKIGLTGRWFGKITAHFY